MDLRESILSADDLRTEPVPTPEWPEVDGQLYVRTLPATEFVNFFTLYDDESDAIKRCRFVITCLVDAEGKSVFSQDDAEALSRKGPAVNRLAVAAQRLNKISTGETLKNSEGATTDVSRSDSA